MPHKYTADSIFSEDNTFHKDIVIVTDDQGTILSIDTSTDHDPSTVQFCKGILIPGFINTHCHLELSHMKGKVNTGTGLLPFLKNVVSFRDIDQETIDHGIAQADQEMYKNGIVAVGDISNKTDTALVKSQSKLDYYTFVEMFDFLQPTMTEATIAQYSSVMEGQSDTGHNKKSYVPHAPYTVSPALFQFINDNNKSGSTVSIHNQETVAENQLFAHGTGGFRDFYNGFGFSLDHFAPNGKSSIHYVIENMRPHHKTIMVHNTLTTKEDIAAALAWNKNTFWATCPNANLYIENRLPDYQAFLDTRATVTIGTDSLTSNWQLSIWDEVKTIKKYQSYLSWETILTWATINGAKALGYDDRLGSLSVGKNPGIILLEGNTDDIQNLKPKRLI